jgi:hypothetical protein
MTISTTGRPYILLQYQKNFIFLPLQLRKAEERVPDWNEAEIRGSIAWLVLNVTTGVLNLETDLCTSEAREL